MVLLLLVMSHTALLQAQADSTGLLVRRPASLESTAKGVALLAGIQSGVIPNLKALAGKRKQGAEVFLPKIDTNARNEWKSRWDNAVSRSLNWHEE